MTSGTAEPRTSTGFEQRLFAAAPLLVDVDEVLRDVADEHRTAALLAEVTRHVRTHMLDAEIWLLHIIHKGEYPTPEQVIEDRNELQLVTVMDAPFWLLDRMVSGPDLNAENTIEVVCDAVLVEADVSAKYDLHTGVQRVARGIAPIWQADRNIVPTAWSRYLQGMRRLRPQESRRLLEWATGDDVLGKDETETGSPCLIVPWHSVVVLVEVPSSRACTKLAALAEFSNSEVVAVGHDCIPLVSADMVGEDEVRRFTHYLRVIKHSRRVSGVSESAANEFRGFCAMLSAQGLTGPDVVVCTNPIAHSQAAIDPALVPDGPPTVVCIGSIEERKNQIAVLVAAEKLWAEGVEFQLRFIGGGVNSSTGKRFIARLRKAQQRGHMVTLETAISETALNTAIATAVFTIFPSLHEGFGLPVAESIALGTPVIASNYGSIKEIGAAGGVEFVNPRDEVDITRAMRLLLSDQRRCQELRDQIAQRPQRSWAEFADELWSTLVSPVIAVTRTGDEALR